MFPSTQYSVIERLQSPDTEIRTGAFEDLVEVYWKPVYKHLRVKWRLAPEDAEDLTQGLFLSAIEKGWLREYDPGKARFRTYVRVCADRLVMNWQQSADRQKRGGGAARVSLDFPGAELELARAGVATPPEADEFFRREFVRAVFERAVAAVQRECDQFNRQVAFELFERYELNPPDGVSYASLAAEFGLTASKGFVHRDLKPANIMVEPFGEVLVLDWGVAKVLAHDETHDPVTDTGPPDEATDQRTEPGTVLGTRAFMAPEQARGATDEIDARTDVYGLGAILLTLLTGQAPQPDAASVLARLGDRHPDVPRPLRAICGRALASAPGDRYGSAQELAADIARFLSGAPVVAYREPVLERAWRVIGKYRVPILLVLAYLVMRIAFAAVARR